MRMVVQASGGEERMIAQKIRFPAWRTAEVGEKFGINASAFKATFSAQRNYSGRAAIWPVWDYNCGLRPRAQGRIGASWNWMQFDRAEASTLRQVEDDELPSPVGQRQGEDQPIRTRCHRLDAGAARNVDRRGGEAMSSRCGGSAARPPAGNDHHQ